MSYCQGCKKAKVTFAEKSGNKNTVRIFDNLPINVKCEERIRTGKFIYSTRTSGLQYPTCNPIGDYAFVDSAIADRYTIQPTLDHEYNRAHNFSCTFYVANFYIGDIKVGSISLGSDYQISFINNPNYSPTSGKTLIIENKNNSVVFTREVANCDYLVACDDDCPPDHVRCETTAYPGYCCIPCKETAAKINNLASKIR